MKNSFEQFNLVEPPKQTEERIKIEEIPQSEGSYKNWLKIQREKLLENEKKNDYVEKSEIYEFGLFAKKSFRAGELISEYLIDR